MDEKKLMKAVRDLREALGLKQDQFTEKIGKKYSTVQSYERKRGPSGKALIPFLRLSAEIGRKDLEEIFKQAAKETLPEIITAAFSKDGDGDRPLSQNNTEGTEGEIIPLEPKPDLHSPTQDASGIDFPVASQELPWVDRLLYILRSGNVGTIEAITQNLDRFELLTTLTNREERDSGTLDKLSKEIALDPVRRVEYFCGLNKRHPPRRKSTKANEKGTSPQAGGDTSQTRKRSGD